MNNNTSIEISINDTLQNRKKYYRMIEIHKDADIETAKGVYKNGILEISFKRKSRSSKSVRVCFLFDIVMANYLEYSYNESVIYDWQELGRYALV